MSDGNELNRKMRDAGMVSFDDLMNFRLPSDRFMTNNQVVDMESFEAWLEQKTSEYILMRIRYELEEKDKDDDLYEWIVSRAGTFREILMNFKKAKGENV